MPTKHAVHLSDDQRRRLDRLTRTGTTHARTISYARALLLVDEADDGMAWSDEKVADALGVSAEEGGARAPSPVCASSSAPRGLTRPSDPAVRRRGVPSR